MASAEVILAKLDERTKYIKEKLDEHIDRETENELPERVAKLETNVSWFKRIGIGVPALMSAIVAAWKGLS
jgi:hypothetical protein